MADLDWGGALLQNRIHMTLAARWLLVRRMSRHAENEEVSQRVNNHYFNDEEFVNRKKNVLHTHLIGKIRWRDELSASIRRTDLLSLSDAHESILVRSENRNFRRKRIGWFSFAKLFKKEGSSPAEAAILLIGVVDVEKLTSGQKGACQIATDGRRGTEMHSQ